MEWEKQDFLQYLSDLCQVC